jgi:N-ethylmaleimide reductase
VSTPSGATHRDPPVSPQAVGYPFTPGLHTDAHVTGWRCLTEAVHAEGGHIFVQLQHCGRVSHPNLLDGATPVAPSAIRPAGQAATYTGPQDFVTPRELKRDELPGIVAQFRHAAELAKHAGFDGVEVHAGNGYLIDQFLRDGSNHRSDAYGGSATNRMRLLNEVLDAVLAEWPAERVGVRLTPENSFNSTKIASVDYRALRTRFTGVFIANNGYDLARAQAAVRTGNARPDRVRHAVPGQPGPGPPPPGEPERAMGTTPSRAASLHVGFRPTGPLRILPGAAESAWAGVRARPGGRHDDSCDTRGAGWVTPWSEDAAGGTGCSSVSRSTTHPWARRRRASLHIPVITRRLRPAWRVGCQRVWNRSLKAAMTSPTPTSETNHAMLVSHGPVP